MQALYRFARENSTWISVTPLGDREGHSAISGLLDDVFAHSQGERFAVSESDLSSRHDIRPLVLKTILTYVELDGFLEQGTPFYAGYSVRPASGEWDDVYAAFDPDRGDFLRRVLATGKEGRVWTGVDPWRDAAASGLATGRKRRSPPPRPPGHARRGCAPGSARRR